MRSRRVRRNLRLLTIVVGVAVGLLAVAAVVSALLIGPTLLRTGRDGRSALVAGRDALIKQDPSRALSSFTRAREIFNRSGSRLSSRATWPLRMIPFVSNNVYVGRSLASIGSRAADAGRAAATALDRLPSNELRLNHGRFDLVAVASAADVLKEGLAAVRGIQVEIGRMRPGWVISPLHTAREEALNVLPGGITALHKAHIALDALPSLLAKGGVKNYLIAFSNLSELRGSGGLFGFVTEMRAADGRLTLEAFKGRPTEVLPPPGETPQTFPSWFPPDFKEQAKIFPNINLTTDFPTVGRIAVNTANAKIPPVDGVIAIDPVGIATLLDITGPITIPRWPSEVTAKNVAQIAQHDVYIGFPRAERRQAFFANLVRIAFGKFVSSDVRLTPERIGSFDSTVGGGHVRMFSTNIRDQAVFDELGLSGSVERASGASDVLSVVSENATGNKGDWFLRRDIHYEVQLDPARDAARSTLDVRFRNIAPASGLPDYVIGSAVADLPRGTNRQIVMLLRSPGDRRAEISIAGEAIDPLETLEGSLRSYRSSVDLPSMGLRPLHATSTVADAFTRDGDEHIYRLHVLAQAVAHPDFLEVNVEVPNGWKAVGTTQFLGDLRGDVTMEIRVRRASQDRVLDTLGAPFRWLGTLFGKVF